MGIQINGTTDTISAVDGSLDINQNATFGNNVTIGGTLTYSDVTNIDSVGLVTAKNGLRIHAGGIDLTSGISTFSDNIQIADKIIHKDDTNTAIRFPAADTFAVETAGSERFRVESGGGIGIGDSIYHLGDTNTQVRFSGADTIQLETGGSNRLKIDANGVVQVTRRLELTNSGDNHHVYEGRAWTWTSNGTSSGTVRAYMYGDSSSNLRIGTNGWNERVRINSGGQVSISGAGTTFNNNTLLNIAPANRTTAFDASDGDSWHDVVLKQTGDATTNAVGLAFEVSASSYHKNAGTGIACVKNGTASDFGADLAFITRPQSAVAQERLRIKSDGNIVATGNIKSNNLPGRNIIINGAMQVAQRKPSGEYTGQAAYATVDRMYGNYSVPNTDPITECHVLTSGDTGPWEKGFRKSYRMKIGYQSGTAASYFYQFQYRIEAQDIANSGWDYTSSSSYITLSFWVKSSVAYNPSWFIRSKHGTEKIYRFQPGTLTANTWTKVTQTIPGNSGITMNDDNTHGLQINLSPYWGTNYTSANPSMETWETFDSATRAKDTVATWFTTNGSTMEITGLQLEVGSIATEFEHLPYAEHLRRCQRYFHRLQGDQGDRAGIGGCCVNSTEARMNVTFPVTMRALPGISGSGTAQFDAENDSADFNCDDMTIESAPTGLIHSLGLQIVTSSMTGGQGGNMRFRSNGSYLDFSAEL